MIDSPLVIDPLDLAVAATLGVPTASLLHDWDEAPDGYRLCTRCRRYAEASGPAPEACCPRYGSDWAATGPVIELLGIEISVNGGVPETWTAAERFHRQDQGKGLLRFAEGTHPLLAVRALILDNPDRVRSWRRQDEDTGRFQR